MALRAVVFDYGMVLSGPPDPTAHAALVRITGLPASRLDTLYWADRHAFDLGELTGHGFWQKLAKEAGLHWSEAEIEELVRWDASMWMITNKAMLDWQRELKQRGLLTAIVSNMGNTIHERMEREFEWLSRFDVLVWSYQLRTAKPDAEIYRYVLTKLDAVAGEVLFIDDRPDNVGTAVTLGMKGVVFLTVEKLRADLMAMGLNSELPFP